MQVAEDQSLIPSDDELLGMPGNELRALARTHGIECRGYADMRARLAMMRDHGLVFCSECRDGVKR
jgi:hypothetical protein